MGVVVLLLCDTATTGNRPSLCSVWGLSFLRWPNCSRWNAWRCKWRPTVDRLATSPSQMCIRAPYVIPVKAASPPVVVSCVSSGLIALPPLLSPPLGKNLVRATRPFAEEMVFACARILLSKFSSCALLASTVFEAPLLSVLVGWKSLWYNARTCTSKTPSKVTKYGTVSHTIAIEEITAACWA